MGGAGDGQPRLLIEQLTQLLLRGVKLDFRDGRGFGLAGDEMDIVFSLSHCQLDTRVMDAGLQFGIHQREECVSLIHGVPGMP